MNLPPYPAFPVLTAEHIILQQILTQDIGDIREITVYEGQQANTEQEALQMLERIRLDYQNGSCIHWGIADKISGKLMGTCGYYRGLHSGKGELGCILKPAFRGHGFMTSAIQCAIDFGIHHIGLKKIIAITTQHNIKAIGVLERLQFIKTLELEDDGVEYELRMDFYNYFLKS